MSAAEDELRIRRRARVSGRVQGVSFRWYTRQRAIELGVAGWVRNELDGSVTIEAEGTRSAVDALLEWATIGPPAARVDSVETIDVQPQGGSAFAITR